VAIADLYRRVLILLTWTRHSLSSYVCETPTGIVVKQGTKETQRTGEFWYYYTFTKGRRRKIKITAHGFVTLVARSARRGAVDAVGWRLDAARRRHWRCGWRGVDVVGVLDSQTSCRVLVSALSGFSRVRFRNGRFRETNGRRRKEEKMSAVVAAIRAVSSLESLDDRLKQLVMLQRFVQLDFLARSIAPGRLEKLDAQIAALRERPDLRCDPVSDQRLLSAVRLWHGDVTLLECDVLVNAVKPTLMFESSLHDAIRSLAGPAFDQQLLKLATDASVSETTSSESKTTLLPLNATVVTDAFQMTHVRKVLNVCTPSQLEDPDSTLLVDTYDALFARFDELCDSGALGDRDTDAMPFTLALPCFAVSLKSFNKVSASAVALHCLRRHLDARLAANRPLPRVALVFFEIETEVVYNRLLPLFFAS